MVGVGCERLKVRYVRNASTSGEPKMCGVSPAGVRAWRVGWCRRSVVRGEMLRSVGKVQMLVPRRIRMNVEGHTTRFVNLPLYCRAQKGVERVGNARCQTGQTKV